MWPTKIHIEVARVNMESEIGQENRRFSCDEKALFSKFGVMAF